MIKAYHEFVRLYDTIGDGWIVWKELDAENTAKWKELTRPTFTDLPSTQDDESLMLSAREYRPKSELKAQYS